MYAFCVNLAWQCFFHSLDNLQFMGYIYSIIFFIVVLTPFLGGKVPYRNLSVASLCLISFQKAYSFSSVCSLVALFYFVSLVAGPVHLRTTITTIND